MVWPHIMPYIVLFRTLHNENKVDSQTKGKSIWKIRRIQFFYRALTCLFVYSWLPSFLIPLLATFAWICFIKPHNPLLVELTGEHKFGFGALNLNLGEVNFNRWLNSPLVVPEWVQLNIAVGFVLTTWIVSSILYFLNIWNMRNMSSMKSESPYHEDGTWYDWSKVINYSDNMDNVRLNVTAYELYGSAYFSLSVVIKYACQLAIFPALFLHTILYHGKDLFQQFQTSLRNRDNDIHCRLMAQYKETPERWFTILFILPITITILVCDYSGIISSNKLLG
ncbi:unnamed protein product [Didymodactylos carnosus]|uniref:Uncharacterized protein n=1 Tax=Didymodactylos carnosus TaxID=1234261 RepID=A0A815RW36_9BILA|nr:unnamed protein product [Didymodactylos carnosus]CAF1578088.1 unnamed protein product [Didymodactylos carnosus]CAF4345482.1 unnamed protein product [Didymodactylos carnosus]CAF4376450.1 unnamed protein product [Didymodactylos carnosus]